MTYATQALREIHAFLDTPSTSAEPVEAYVQVAPVKPAPKPKCLPNEDPTRAYVDRDRDYEYRSPYRSSGFWSDLSPPGWIWLVGVAFIAFMAVVIWHDRKYGGTDYVVALLETRGLKRQCWELRHVHLYRDDTSVTWFLTNGNEFRISSPYALMAVDNQQWSEGHVGLGLAPGQCLRMEGR